MNDVIASIDIGGTHLRCALSHVSAPESFLHRTRTLIDAEAGAVGVTQQIEQEITRCFSESDIQPSELMAVGCTVPGFTDAEAGVVISAANLSGWRNIPLVKMLTEKFGVPCFIENDVRAAATGEYECGAGKGSHSLVYFTISTGVSAGIIMNGKLLRGYHNIAGEIAYFVTEPQHLDQDWGANGCLELLAAGVGLATEWEKSGQSQADDSAVEIFKAARAGNATAQHLISRAADYLAQTAIALCLIVNPEVMIIGGGIADNEPEIFQRMVRAMKAACPYLPRICSPVYGSDSPLVGAASMAASKMRIRQIAEPGKAIGQD